MLKYSKYTDTLTILHIPIEILDTLEKFNLYAKTKYVSATSRGYMQGAPGATAPVDFMKTLIAPIDFS